MKVLFLTKYPVEGASSRYRVYQYLPYLKNSNVDHVVSSFMSEKFYKLSFSSGSLVTKSYLTLFAILKRLCILVSWKKYDVIYMQRELFPVGPPLIEKLLKKMGATLVYDYDDALFINKTNQYNKLIGFFRKPNKTIEIFKTVDCVLAGNDYLRDTASSYCKNAITFEVAEDTQRFKKKATRQDASKLIIGWLGSKTTVKYLNYIAVPLAKIQEKYPKVKFQVMGGDPDFSIPNVSIDHLTWSLENELIALNDFDIGIMPLPNEEWSQGKSGGKARTYMAAGVVPVVTGIGYNLQLIENGETGFFCNCDQQWFDTIGMLIENIDLREDVANKARDYVMEHFDVEKQALKMAEILKALLPKTTTLDNKRVN